jgi:predicted enzyme involved in methoxymalonyl-ACP biosynthesis
VERTPNVWTIKLLLASCRVIARGVGDVLLGCVMNRAGPHGVRVRAELVETPRNEPIVKALAAAGFEPTGDREGPVAMHEAIAYRYYPIPPYMQVTLALDDGASGRRLRT